LLYRAGFAAASCCWLAVVAALILYLPGSCLERVFPVLRLLRWENTPLQQAFVRDEAVKLEKALEIYRLMTGSYPETPRAIADYGILAKQEIDSIERHAIVYKKTGGSYAITIGP
jgi:hypothetical protein